MIYKKGQAVVWWIIAIIAVVIIVALLIPYLNRDDVQPGTEVTVSDIILNSEEYINEEVAVRGEIERYIGERAFVLDTIGAVNDQILVVSASAIGTLAETGVTTATSTATTTATTTDEITPSEFIFTYQEGTQVTVTGTVRMFNLASLEQEINADLDDDLFDEFENTPVIVANNVTANNNVIGN